MATRDGHEVIGIANGWAGLADEYYTSDVAYLPATDRVGDRVSHEAQPTTQRVIRNMLPRGLGEAEREGIRARIGDVLAA